MHGLFCAGANDGKIKAPTAVGRMWLVGLVFLQFLRLKPAGAFSVLLKNFNSQSAFRTVQEGLWSCESAGRPVQGPTRPYPPWQPRRQARQELRRRGDAGGEEGRTCREKLQSRRRPAGPIDLWPRATSSFVPIVAIAPATGRGHDPDRASSRSTLSVRSSLQARRLSQARGRHPRRRARGNVRRRNRQR